MTSTSTNPKRAGWVEARDRHLPLLLAHRGARRSAPENTLQAFDRALRHGCDGFEFDVQRTADGAPLICHDPKFQDHVVHKTKLADFVGALTLPDVVSRYASNAFLNIELKVSGLEEVTIQAITATPPARGFLVSSFLPEVLQRMIELAPHVQLGLICESKKQLKHWPKVSCSAIIAKTSLVDEELRASTQEAGKQLMVWTVNDSGEMLRFAAMGVDAVVSDETRLLVDTLRPKIS